MINDLVPIIVEKYMNEYKDQLVLDIQTVINGQVVGSDAIIADIQKALANQLKF